MGRVIIIGLVVILLIVGTGWLILRVLPQAQPETQDSITSQVSENEDLWVEQEVAVAGKYADADVVDLGDGRFRMYYAIEPEVSGNQLEVYSALSADGITWTPEAGVRRTLSTFPDVMKLPDNTWRMYFQNSGVIKSAISTDGLKWTDEAGTRVDAVNTLGLALESVGASTTILVSDGTYLMVYRGTINSSYNSQVPNKTQGVLLIATSADGLEWEKKGFALDTRTNVFEGWADGPEWINRDDGSLGLYFWGYKGIYESAYSNTFGSPELIYRGPNVDQKVMYSPNPPGDPTLAKIGSAWMMYYGQHEKGIYRATLK
ncbi:hypothetical protein HYW32_00885 [Candidatus Berkelbacteria bacterium]|nr:hypothetical protein [Candidatus Berkelbacteria bacterium]